MCSVWVGGDGRYTGKGEVGADGGGWDGWRTGRGLRTKEKYEKRDSLGIIGRRI